MEISIKVDTYQVVYCCDSCGHETEKRGETLFTRNGNSNEESLMYIYICKKCKHQYYLDNIYPRISYRPSKKED